jgi:hypothetical protein
MHTIYTNNTLILQMSGDDALRQAGLADAFKPESTPERDAAAYAVIRPFLTGLQQYDTPVMTLARQYAIEQALAAEGIDNPRILFRPGSSRELNDHAAAVMKAHMTAWTKYDTPLMKRARQWMGVRTTMREHVARLETIVPTGSLELMTELAANRAYSNGGLQGLVIDQHFRDGLDALASSAILVGTAEMARVQEVFGRNIHDDRRPMGEVTIDDPFAAYEQWNAGTGSNEGPWSVAVANERLGDVAALISPDAPWPMLTSMFRQAVANNWLDIFFALGYSFRYHVHGGLIELGVPDQPVFLRRLFFHLSTSRPCEYSAQQNALEQTLCATFLMTDLSIETFDAVPPCLARILLRLRRSPGPVPADVYDKTRYMLTPERQEIVLQNLRTAPGSMILRVFHTQVVNTWLPRSQGPRLDVSGRVAPFSTQYGTTDNHHLALLRVLLRRRDRINFERLLEHTGRIGPGLNAEIDEAVKVNDDMTEFIQHWRHHYFT